MFPICLICNDPLDGVVSSLVINCGHVFHEICLHQWFNEKKSCPSCRKFVTKNNYFKLYLQFETEQSSFSEVTNVDVLRSEIVSLKNECKNVQLEAIQSKKDAADLRKIVTDTETENLQLQAKLSDANSDTIELKARCKNLDNKARLIESLTHKNHVLKQEMEGMKTVRMILNGTKQDVEEILRSNKDNSNAVHQYATYCSVLNVELNNMKKNKKVQADEITHLRSKLMTSSLQNQMGDKKLVTLKDQCEQLEKENQSLLKKCETITSDKSVIESPAAERTPNLNRTANDITPIADRPMKRLKVNMLSNLVNARVSSQPFSSRLKPGPAFKLHNSQDSIVRQGYNGLGGHSKYVFNTTTSTSFTFPKSKRAKPE